MYILMIKNLFHICSDVCVHNSFNLSPLSLMGDMNGRIGRKTRDTVVGNFGEDIMLANCKWDFIR